MTSLTVENYVKCIYTLCLDGDDAPASTGVIAESLAVSPGAVTSMMKTLSESGLAEYTPYEGVRLTDAGRALALRVVRRHRLIELFLSHTLELSWDEVHEEAENMEHAVSDWLVDKMDQYLGHPDADPHGDPIPRADGTVARLPGRSLQQWDIGESFRLVRVLDQSPEFLRYLSNNGLSLGAQGRVREHHPEAGVLVLELADGDATLAWDAAGKLLGEPPGGAGDQSVSTP